MPGSPRRTKQAIEDIDSQGTTSGFSAVPYSPSGSTKNPLSDRLTALPGALQNRFQLYEGVINDGFSILIARRLMSPLKAGVAVSEMFLPLLLPPS